MSLWKVEGKRQTVEANLTLRRDKTWMEALNII